MGIAHVYLLLMKGLLFRLVVYGFVFFSLYTNYVDMTNYKESFHRNSLKVLRSFEVNTEQLENYLRPQHIVSEAILVTQAFLAVLAIAGLKFAGFLSLLLVIAQGGLHYHEAILTRELNWENVAVQQDLAIRICVVLGILITLLTCKSCCSGHEHVVQEESEEVSQRNEEQSSKKKKKVIN